MKLDVSFVFFVALVTAVNYTGLYTVSKKGTSILLPITLADVDGFSKFFHC